MKRNIENVDVAVAKNDINNIKGDVVSIIDKFKEYVTITRFSPVEKIVYGMVSVIFLTVIGAIVGLVIRSK